ncbi:glycosyltransferase family 8 protein [Helicobacter suis]|uniref:glycosyltransferase family 8 protein n=1 Tax=Helicobacter suis TaxID=104628 RepID=UPI001F086B3F|nr:glycosyltransferase [Helicobacter suis]
MITIPIVMAFDLNYYVAGGVAMYSLLMHAAQEREGEPLFYKIHLLIQGLDFSHQQELVKIAAPFADFSAIIFHDIGQKQSGFGKFFEQNITPILPYLRPGLLKRFSSLVLYRFFLSSLFPEYDKIIACDVDILFERDISPAYFAFDANEPYYLAAVRENWHMSVEHLEETYKNTAKDLGAGSNINSRADMETLFCCCINVGFIVVNLKKWREDSLESRMIAIFKEKGSKLVAFEQEVINFACQGQILELPRIYNYVADVFNDYSEMQTPVVWHFLGHKPWKFIGGGGGTEIRFKRWMRVFLLASMSSEKFMTHALITHPSKEFMDSLITHFQNNHLDLSLLDCMISKKTLAKLFIFKVKIFIFKARRYLKNKLTRIKSGFF